MKSQFSILSLSFLILANFYSIGYCQDPKDDATAQVSMGYYEAAYGRFEKGDFESARDFIDKAINAYSSKTCYCQRAEVDCELEDFTSAIGDCGSGLKNTKSKFDQDNIDGALYLQLGIANQIIGKKDEAKKDFEKVGLDEYLTAINEWLGKPQISPNFFHEYLEKSQAQLAMGKYKEAIKTLDELISKKPQYMAAYRWRGAVKFEMADYNGAIKDYNSALGLLPTYAAVWRLRGWTRYKLGKYKEAMPDFDKAIKLKKDNFLAFYQRGLCKTKLGKFKEAIADFDNAIKFNDKYAKAYYHRGMAKKELGDEKGSQEDLDKAVELASADEEESKDKK